MNWSRDRVIGAVLVLLLVCFAPAKAAGEPEDGYVQVSGLIHIDSSISGGEDSPEALAAAAYGSGAEFAVLTDHDTQKASYGLPPFRNILRVSCGRPSVRSYGVRNYVEKVGEIDTGMKNFVLFPGIEAVPYYTWSRNIDGSLALRHLHRHLLVLGLDRADDLERLPSIEAGYPMRFTVASLLHLLWLAPFLTAVFLLTLPVAGAAPGWNGIWWRRSRGIRVILWGMLFISVLAIADAYPFQERVIDQYSPDRGAAPYQEVIDYVGGRGGLTFWAHPEAVFRMPVGEGLNPAVRFLLNHVAGGGLSLETEAYPGFLNETRNYTGFAIFHEGCRTVGKPEGLWDDLLLQFCSGKRRRPVWAISEMDMESGVSSKAAGESRTVLLVREKAPGAYLDALRLGRMYCFAAFMDGKLRIREYAVTSGGVRAVSGEILAATPDARLVFDLEQRGAPMTLRAVIVRDGKIFSEETISGPGRVNIALPAPGRSMGYVRVAVFRGQDMIAATNPIFLTREGAR